MTTKNIKELLNEGVVVFEFMKKDGSIRTAKGTTKHNIITTEGAEGKGGVCIPKKVAGYTPYYDMDKHSWRCFHEDKLVKIISASAE